MESIKISVIIPVYNVEKYIRECVESVLNQTLKDIEIIAVNDGSRDNSIKIIEEYLSDARLRIINKENGGASFARNIGMKAARGEYIYFIDSDDFIEEDVLEILYRKEFLEKYNFRFIEGIIHEDQDFGFKTILLAENIKYIKNYGYKYRVEREGSVMSSQKREKNLKSVQILKKELKNFFSNIQLNEFQKIRVYFKLLSLDFWEKELKNEKIIAEEIEKFEDSLEKIYQNNRFNCIEKQILKNDIRNLIKNKKINILKKIYWKNGIINFKILKNFFKKEVVNKK